MGRKKITIEPITDERNRHVTFNKRKSGLIKKAMELSILCNCQISFLVFNAENQLFEYCSTDPRLILQQYCKVAHLPHERLSNADYSRFDKASRGTKAGRGKKGQSENSNSIANESSNEMSNQGMPQNMIKQEDMHMPQRRQSISGVSGFMEGHMGAQMMQQPVIQIPQQQYVEQMQRRASISYDPNQMVQQHQQQHQHQQQVSQQLMDAVGLLTPVTPNTVEQVMLNQMNQQHMMHQQHQQQQQEDSPQQIGFHQVQQQLMQQQDQLAAYRNDAAKRKFEQASEQEDYPESKRTRMGAHLAPIQVPSNPQALPMKRMENDEQQQQQQQQQGNENWQQQHNTGNEGEGFTPLTGGFLFSPIMNNLSTPMAINVGVDWNNAKKDQGST